MSRSTRHEVEEIPAHPKTVTVVTKTCDRCGKDLTDDWQDTDAVAQEVLVVLNEQVCVAFRRRRDYCPPCSVIIWEAINKIIGADAEAEYDPDINDWY
jgi:hypothetical protein